MPVETFKTKTRKNAGSGSGSYALTTAWVRKIATSKNWLSRLGGDLTLGNPFWPFSSDEGPRGYGALAGYKCRLLDSFDWSYLTQVCRASSAGRENP